MTGFPNVNIAYNVGIRVDILDKAGTSRDSFPFHIPPQVIIPLVISSRVGPTCNPIQMVESSPYKSRCHFIMADSRSAPTLISVARRICMFQRY